MSAPELKPCPFCGGDAIPAVNDHARMWVIRCRKCNAEVWEKNDGHHHQDFIPMINAAWNRRADLATDPAKVQALDIPSIAREVANFPETIRAHTVAAAIALETMDVHQRLVRVEDVGSYIDRILAAWEGRG
jgi:hypothetical protein